MSSYSIRTIVIMFLGALIGEPVGNYYKKELTDLIKIS